MEDSDKSRGKVLNTPNYAAAFISILLLSTVNRWSFTFPVTVLYHAWVVGRNVLFDVKGKNKSRIWQVQAFVVVVVNYPGALVQALFRVILPIFSAETIHHIGCVSVICCDHCLHTSSISNHYSDWVSTCLQCVPLLLTSNWLTHITREVKNLNKSYLRCILTKYKNTYCI